MTASEVSILAARVGAAVQDRELTTKRMFGGITFLLDGNMLCCVSPKGLMVRVGAEAEPHALESPHASPCLGTGRPMPGFVMIEPGALGADRELRRWIALARAYVEKLPPKQTKQGGSLPAKAKSAQRAQPHQGKSKERS
jgi:TfoX/Sxy family transcriptional regulator of competence genes